MKEKLEKTKGITLIALVVTIVVLLILAGITIGTLTGDNSIIDRAKASKESAEREALEEQIEAAIIVAEQKHKNPTLDQVIKEIMKIETVKEVKENGDIENTLGDPITGKLDDYLKKEESKVTIGKKVQETKKDNYKDEDGDVATVPKGFAIVPECGDISEGLVISDVENDTENQGNQFVWIPVNYSNFERMGGYCEKAPQELTDAYKEPYTATGYSTKEEGNTEIEEEGLMRNSVQTYGGFYIGRYEAGQEEGKVVVKKNKSVYNNVKWGNSMTDLGGNGAVQLARNFVKTTYEENYTKVKSTLVYGVQWDAVMQFMDSSYSNKTYDASSYVKDSAGKGWYSDNYSSIETGNTQTNGDYTTGKDLIYKDNPTVIANKQKNIYDMGGNVEEWTMEANETDTRVVRGGAYFNDGSNVPTSIRGRSILGNKIGFIGFRVALYL